MVLNNSSRKNREWWKPENDLHQNQFHLHRPCRENEFQSIWRVRDWRQYFSTIWREAGFTMDLDACSLRFFFQSTPGQVNICQGPDRVFCTEWLSLFATLHSGTLPALFDISVIKLDRNNDFAVGLVTERRIAIQPYSCSDLNPKPEVVIPHFFPLKTYRLRSQTCRRQLPQVPLEDELRLLFKVTPLPQGFLRDSWDLLPTSDDDDQLIDMFLVSGGDVKLAKHKSRNLRNNWISDSSDKDFYSQASTSTFSGFEDEITEAAAERIPLHEKPTTNTAASIFLKATTSSPKRRKRKKREKGADRPVRSLFCLGLKNPLRRWCYAITESKPFEYLLLTTILATCWTLAWTTPFPNGDSNATNEKIEESEIIFTCIFTAECFMRIIAQGLIAHEGAYLRDGVWNILDFVIVVVGLLSSILSSAMEGSVDLKALRAFRVLRPLKLVSNVPPLQVVMNSILMAMIPLFNISILVFFVMALYAIIGLQMFQGRLHQTCFHNLTGEMMDEPSNCGGGYNCEDVDGEIWECRPYWDGPNNGITNFDNIGLAMLTVYQCISLEGWTDVMYSLQDGMGAGWEWVYFVSMVFFGAFFTMNLILGVLSGEFGKQKEKVESRHSVQKQREKVQVETSLKGYLMWITIASQKIQMQEAGLTNSKMPPTEKYGFLEEVEEERNYFWTPYLDSFKRVTKPSRRMCRALIKSEFWFWAVIVLVFLNTMVLATEHYGQPIWLEELQEYANVFFVSVFVLEMFLKMYSLGFPRYFRSLFNRFDFFATVLSVVELALVKAKVINPLGVSVLRCVRLLRTFKITRYWGAMCSLIKSLLASLESIASLLVLLYLFLMIFALLGMQIFGGKFGFDPSDHPTRSNFDRYAQALVTMFQVLTGEDWNEVMYAGIAADGGDITSSGMIIATVYFLVLFTLGNYILLNVFLAIAVDGLELEPEVDKEEVEDDECGASGGGDGEAQKGESSEKSPRKAKANHGEPEEEPPLPPIPDGSSFFCLSHENCLRVNCYNFLCNKFIGAFLLLCILVSSAALAAEDPVHENSNWNHMLGEVDSYFFTPVFTIELLLKLIVYGVVFHEGAFCRSFANMLDLIVVGVSLISLVSPSGDLGAIKILRVARVLRPLRAINRAKGLKRVIQAMIVAIKTIGNIVIVTTLLIFMYAVIGVQLFKGALFQCTDGSKHTPHECQGNFLVYPDRKPVMEEREWLNSAFNFDSVTNGMLTLFAISTFEGWPQMLYKCIDAVGEDQAPVYNNRFMVAFFFISFLVIVSFYMINIFVGFVILTFQEEGEAEFHHLEMDKNQRDCIEFALNAKPIPKYMPNNPIQAKVWAIVSSPLFDNVSLLLVILSTITMGMGFYKQPEWYTDRLEQADSFFGIAFTLEFFLKLVALGPREYFKDVWNTLDAVIVAGSYVDVIYPQFPASFLRLFRAGRLIKLLNKSEGLRTILLNFIKSLRALPYVILLILLVFFIYGIIGMQTFGKIALDEATEIHRNNNFQNFGNAMILLFRCATGEAWQEVMMACVAEEHVKCLLPQDEGKEEVSCGSNLAYPYFISFFVLCAFLVLNLLVAVIMDNFDYLTRDTSILGPHHLGAFVQAWSDIDPEATGYAKLDDVVTLLKSIEPPLGFGMMCPGCTVRARMTALNLPMTEDGKVGFNATLLGVIRFTLQIRVTGTAKKANEELRMVIKLLWGHKNTKSLDHAVPPPEALQERMTTGKFYATVMLQQKLKQWLKKRRGPDGRPVFQANKALETLQMGLELLHSLELSD